MTYVRLAMRAGVTLLAMSAFALTVSAAGQAGASIRSADPFVRQNQPKLDSQLSPVAGALGSGGASAALAAARVGGLPVESSKVRVIVVAKSGARVNAAAAITTSGGEVIGSAGLLTEALVAPSALDQLAANPAVAEVRPPTPHAATAVDEAVHLSDADVWHSAGYGGGGVKVAIVDLGFYGYTSLLGTALPSSVTAIDHCSGNLSAAPPAGTEHGTAVAELVHQMAPAAQLYLICVDSEVGLAEAEQDAISDGIRIINHSVDWFNSSRGDGSGAPGTPDAIAADARAHGILWVNAAGNEGQDHWSGQLPQSQGAVVFPTSEDQYDRVTIESGETACAYLKWDAWPLTTEDYDLGLVRMGDSSVVAASTNDQADGPSPPTEALCYTNSGATQTFGLAIVAYNAVGSPRLDLYFTGSSPLQDWTDGGVTEPASSPATLAVGAQCWNDNTAEPYSSRGPTIDGRIKPDLMADDIVSTETYGTAQGCNPDTGFAGTSAASPQVAGAAALVLQHDPGLTPAGISAELAAASAKTEDDAFPGTQVDDLHGAGVLAMPPLQNRQRIAAALVGLTVHSRTTIGSASGVVTMNADGSGARFVTVGAEYGTAGPTWSPDGRTIAYTADGKHTRLVDSDGSDNRTSDTVGTQLAPVWGPSGDVIAYADGKDIWVGTAGQEGGTRLTTDGVANANGMPAWSPDGTKIAWIHAGQLWVMNADGSNKTQISSGGQNAAYPSWSPDGRHIAFTYQDDVATRHIEVVDPTGANPVSVTTSYQWSGTQPTWLSDSATIVYTDQFAEFFTVPASGGTPTLFAINPMLGDSITYLEAWGQALQPVGALLSPPENTDMNDVVGDPAVGGSLSEPWTGWTGAVPMTFVYQWQRCTPSGLSCANIAGANDSSYSPAPADLGSRLALTATATNANGSATGSTLTPVVVGPPRPSPMALPTISGSTAAGATLTSTAGTWQNAGVPFTFRWLRCDTDGSSCSAIAGATGASYILGGSDVGSTVRVAIGEPFEAGWVFASSPQSAVVDASSGGGGGGSGGSGGGGGSSGGGGGGGAIPDLMLTVGGPVQVAEGGQAAFSLAVSDLNGATATGIHLIVTLPAGAVVDLTSSDRGSGCTAAPTAGTLDCSLDFLSGSLVAHVAVVLTLPAPGEATLSASVSEAQGDKNTVDNTGSATVQVGTPTPTPTPTPSPPPATTTPSAAVHCVVPRLAGKTLATAKKAIGRAHCSVGQVKRKPSRQVERGRISAESPRVGSKLRRSAKINLTISAGKPKA